MWLEVKIILSIFAMMFLGIVFSAMIYSNILLAFLLVFAGGLILFGDIVIGYQIKHNHLDVIMDNCPSDKEICVLFDFGGNIDFVKTKKGPLGTRQFMKYNKEATVINDGRYQVRFINGNHGFVGHESYDKNIDLHEAEAFDKLPGDSIDDIVDKLPLIPRQFEEVENDG